MRNTYKTLFIKLSDCLAEEKPNLKKYKRLIHKLPRVCAVAGMDVPAMWKRSVKMALTKDDRGLLISMHRVRSVLRSIPWSCNIDSEEWLKAEVQ